MIRPQGRSLVVFATRDDGRGKSLAEVASSGTRGQAAACGQSALFDKGRALGAMLLSLRRIGKEKDGVGAALSVIEAKQGLPDY